MAQTSIGAKTSVDGSVSLVKQFVFGHEPTIMTVVRLR